MAWGRVVRLVAQNRDMVQVDVSALRIDARCVRSRVFNDNEMEATIITPTATLYRSSCNAELT
jgi:hypothetical protein